MKTMNDIVFANESGDMICISQSRKSNYNQVFARRANVEDNWSEVETFDFDDDPVSLSVALNQAILFVEGK